MFNHREYLEHDVTVTTEKVHEVADLTAAKLNASLVELRRLFLVEDLVDSVKFALVLWLLTYVGSLFNGLTLVILGKSSLSLQHYSDEFTDTILYFSRRGSFYTSQSVRNTPRKD